MSPLTWSSQEGSIIAPIGNPKRYAGVLSAIRKEKVLLSPLRLLPSSFRIRINSGPKLVIYGVLCTTKLL
jgi:hypothetical protein